MVSELKKFLTTEEFPLSRGVRPLCACGTQFVEHKVRAMERVLDRLGAYINHPIALTEDPSSKLKLADKQKLKGYVRKWRDGKVLLGCALFHDILKPYAILCKYFQVNELPVVSAIESILKSRAAMNLIKSTEFEALPSVRMVLLRLTDDVSSCGNEVKTYQCVEVVKTEEAIAFFKIKYQGYVDSVLACLRDSIKDDSSDTALLSHMLRVLATHGWQKNDDALFGVDAVQALARKFMLPLEKAGVNCALLQEEWVDMVSYAKSYINLVQDAYPVVWWKLLNCAGAAKWTNILTVVELVFCLPLSNGHVELQKWEASNAIKLWWEAKTRRVDTIHSGPRSRKSSEKTVCESSVDDDLDLTDWDTWSETGSHSETSDSECSDESKTENHDADCSDMEED